METLCIQQLKSVMFIVTIRTIIKLQTCAAQILIWSFTRKMINVFFFYIITNIFYIITNIQILLHNQRMRPSFPFSMRIFVL